MVKCTDGSAAKRVKDILIACIDNLGGFEEAIGSIYPKTEVQSCIVHQVRNTLKYVVSKDSKAIMVDIKQIYRASNKELAEDHLDAHSTKILILHFQIYTYPPYDPRTHISRKKDKNRNFIIYVCTMLLRTFRYEK